MITRLNWLSIGVISTIQKIPGLFLFRFLFDLHLRVCLMLGLLGFAASAIGIKFSMKKFKQLIAWSSVGNMRVLLVLIVIKSSLAVMYYIFYSLIVLTFCSVINYSDQEDICKSFITGSRRVIDMLVSGLLLIFSGLPPFISFLLKVYLIRGFYLYDSVHMLMDIDVNGKEISFFYLLGS